MLFAAIALRYAFPYQVYAAGCVTDSRGRSVTMQSISSSLKVHILNMNISGHNLLIIIIIIISITFCRKQWIQKILWPMPSIISIHSTNNIRSIAPVCSPHLPRLLTLFRAILHIYFLIYISFIYLDGHIIYIHICKLPNFHTAWRSVRQNLFTCKCFYVSHVKFTLSHSFIAKRKLITENWHYRNEAVIAFQL